MRDCQFIICEYSKPTAVDHSVVLSDLLSKAMCNNLLLIVMYQHAAYLHTSDWVEVTTVEIYTIDRERQMTKPPHSGSGWLMKSPRLKKAYYNESTIKDNKKWGQ